MRRHALLLTATTAALFFGALLSAADAQTRDTAPGTRSHVARRQRSTGAPSKDAAVATFPGFRTLEGGGTRIYVDLSSNVVVEEHRDPGVLIYSLKDARVGARNNRNALITTYFNTPVSSARLVQAGADLNLVISLRAQATPTERVVARDNGRVSVQVDFPPGDYPKTNPTTPVASGSAGPAKPPAPPSAPPSEDGSGSEEPGGSPNP